MRRTRKVNVFEVFVEFQIKRRKKVEVQSKHLNFSGALRMQYIELFKEWTGDEKTWDKSET